MRLTKLPSLDIFNDHYPGRFPAYWEIKHLGDVVEILQFSTGKFSEPLAFSVRAWQALKRRTADFDLVHDNQSLGYGLLAIEQQFPTIVTLHHPITVDRRLEMEHAPTWRKRVSVGRWYSFVKMQARVARRMPCIVVVSENSIKDITEDMGVEGGACRWCRSESTRTCSAQAGHRRASRAGSSRRPRPTSPSRACRSCWSRGQAPHRAGRHPHRDRPAQTRRPGRGHHRALGPGRRHHVGLGRPDERIVELYAEASLAVVPSLYEGFSLPAIEAMATGTCLVATTGGALPEVTGPDGESVLSCPPGTPALARHRRGLADEDLRACGRGRSGRVVERWSWRHCAAAHRGPVPGGPGPAENQAKLARSRQAGRS